MLAFRSMMSSRLPLVIILGATGTGKTKLSVELAQKYGAEIISADSMQIYKGLDVVTAKVTKQERSLAPHHLLDILEPHQMFTVVDFRNRALKIIDNLTAQGKIPIVVGGTMYYIESIVYQILIESVDFKDDSILLSDKSRKRRLDESEEGGSEKSEKFAKTNKEDDEPQSGAKPSTSNTEEKTPEISKEKAEEFINNEKNYTNEEIHEMLKAIDPDMASQLHLNNRRKVLRSIEVWVQTGHRHSEILDNQKVFEGQLRKPKETIIFWLKCDQTVLEKRLDARVDSMLEQGLIQELLDFHARHNQQRIQDGTPPDYTKGIFQTLGFKEFHDYLMLAEEKRDTEEGKKLLQLSIDNMKLATKRYARRQNKMVKGRFLEHPFREVPPIYELDTTEPSKWDEEVKNKAIKIIESFINESSCEFEPIAPTSKEDKKIINTKSSNYCEVCKKFLIGDKTYEIHMNSNKHKKSLNRLNPEKQSARKRRKNNRSNKRNKQRR